MKLLVNSACPCGSGKKYKKCCRVFHHGKNTQTALELMKSRYCAYATDNTNYIMDTTHKSNNEYNSNKVEWEESIKVFMNDTQFNSLEILEFIEVGEDESFVTFKANILVRGNDASFVEKSKFVKQKGKWFYLSGEFNQ